MTEKEFKKIINDNEVSIALKNELMDYCLNFAEKLQMFLSKNITLTDTTIVGPLIQGIEIKDCHHLDIMLVFNKKHDLSNNNMQKVVFNELENALIYSGIQYTELEKNIITNNLNVKLEDGKTIHLIIRYDNDDKYASSYELQKIKLIETINQTYTYYKNTLKILAYYIETEKIKYSNPYLIAIILASGLYMYQSENKYYNYLQVFNKALDEFLNGKRLEIKALEASDNDVTVNQINNKYTIIDPVLPSFNIAYYLTDINISDLRRLRKKIAKEVELSNEEGFTFDNSTEIVIDINPITNEETETLAWSYSVIGKNLKNSGGIYTNDEESYQTAVLKGMFKGLKAVIDNGLIKKKIYIKTDIENIWSPVILSNDENKSRMKTIKSLIEKNKLNIIVIK